MPDKLTIFYLTVIISLVFYYSMKKDIHPEYFPKATAKCVCGATHTVGSTQKHIEVEICSNCHPFYTGKQQLVDTAGRVERFKARKQKAQTTPKKVKKVRAKKQNK